MPLGRDRFTVLMLSAAQALFMSSSVISVALGGLVGFMLAEDKAWATLPLGLVVFGGAATVVPASFLMRRLGRRPCFLAGAMASVAGGVLSVIAIQRHDFVLFCIASVLLGIYRGFAQYYRFAATDVAEAGFRGRAVSYVLAGGVVAAIAGPQLAIWSMDMLAPYSFAGAFVVISILGLIALFPLGLVRIPKPTAAELRGPKRPLSVIMGRPVFAAAALNAGLGYGIMALLMSATPLSIIDSGFSVADSTLVVQWHVLAMFIPSFFTGALIQRFGLLPVLWAGMGLFALCVVFALAGTQLSNFTLALVTLGVAWNFTYVGGTTLLAESHTPAEQAKTQGANEFLVAVASGLGTMAAGGIFHRFGWQAVNYSALPILLLIVLATAWYALSSRRA